MLCCTMVNFNHSPKSQLWVVWFQIWQGWLCSVDQQPCQVWFGSYQRWRPHVMVKYTGRVPFIIILLVCSFLATRTAQTREPIFTHAGVKLRGSRQVFTPPPLVWDSHLKFGIHNLQSGIHYLLIEIHRTITQLNDAMDELPPGRLVNHGSAFKVKVNCHIINSIN